ncbi:hypothetical protein MLD38_028278 [Melastoma candidum]|uniref:Uncharacterized protein n=1 Tax=Melastoma candidum TaxID=119954 RepID=A0ACB9N4W3_9MYRT|nr:hypothetical protein MLD38_028278 [Melastoma candidum]
MISVETGMDSHDKKMPDVVVLNSGHEMPVIALGTAAQSLPPRDVLASILVDAMEVGYRHFDTASLYGSESSLGDAVREALRRGIVASRDELFITTKLWCTDADAPLVLPALKESLKRLGMVYVDLYLIHWPVRVVHGTEGFDYQGKLLPFDISGTWAAMEECSRLGLAKSIGMSNFSSRKISQILDSCTIPPAINQVEMNVVWQQTKLREFCKEKGIHVSAWSPLGANGAAWGSLAVMESAVLKEIADRRGLTVPQVALKWVLEQGAVVIVKSFNKERMKENLKIFGWKLTERELEKIKGIPQRRGFSGEIFIDPVNGPYKSVEELFDEDS